MALCQRPDHLHRARFDRVRASHEIMVQLRDTRMIHHACNAEPSCQTNRLRLSQRKLDPIQADWVQRRPYECYTYSVPVGGTTREAV